MEEERIAPLLSLDSFLMEEIFKFPDVKLSNWNILEHYHLTSTSAPRRICLTEYIWARSSLNPDTGDLADDILSIDEQQEQLVGIQ